MKIYNERNDADLQFRGFDMQNGQSALEALKEFARRHDDDLLVELAELEKLYNRASKDRRGWEAVYNKSEEVLRYLQSKDNTGVEAGEAATDTTWIYLCRACPFNIEQKLQRAGMPIWLETLPGYWNIPAMDPK